MEPMIIEVAEDTPSIAYRARRLPARHAEFVREEIDRLMEKGIIVRAKSRFASPILVVPKKGNKFRMVIDYRRINTCIVDMSFPLPDIESIFHALQGQEWFATVDLKSGYHQISVETRSQQYTAFASSEGLFQFKRIPVGIKTAPIYFQKCMSEAFSDLIMRSCIIYIDDIIIFGKSKDEFIKNFEEVM
ncbi:hypothetical protein ADUPG1_002820, partial [Aduncisulcus paluster]